MPNVKKTHNDFRKVVCLCCFRKGKALRNVSQNDRDTIEEYLVSGLDPLDERLPTVLCLTCRGILNKYRSGDFSNRIEMFDLSKLKTLKPDTRNSSPCECTVCLIGKSTPFNFKENLPRNVPQGRPCPNKTIPTPIKMCSVCLSPIGRGKPHECCNSNRLENLKSIVASSPAKTDEKLAASIILDKAQHSKGNIQLTRGQGGKPLSLCVGKQELKKPTPINFKEFQDISNHLDHSVNKTLNLAKDLRFVTKNRHIVLPNLREHIVQSSHALDSMFTVVLASLKCKVAKDKYENVDTPVVYCTDIDSLIDTVIEERGSENFELKLGIDGGGGFLKVCLNIVSLDEKTTTSKRARYSDGVASKLFKSTSVKKLIILALAPGVLETHQNMFLLWELLRVSDSFKTKHPRFSTDLKMANVLLGLMSHSSCHPCSWCNIHRLV